MTKKGKIVLCSNCLTYEDFVNLDWRNKIQSYSREDKTTGEIAKFDFKVDGTMLSDATV